MFSLTTNYQLLPTINFAILICFEDLFPELSRKFVQEGAQFLTVITNDAWYKRTSAAFQHLSASVFRAVENRVYVLRAANTGVSGFIQPSGRFSALAGKDGSEIFVTGQMTETINIESYHPTVYNRWGDFFVAICAIFSVILRPRRGRRISN
jgi:apolipoprotein N-acyltransferase